MATLFNASPSRLACLPVAPAASAAPSPVAFAARLVAPVSRSAAAAARRAAATASLTTGCPASFFAALPALRSPLGNLLPVASFAPALPPPPALAFLSFFLPIRPLLFDDYAPVHSKQPLRQRSAAHRVAAGLRHQHQGLLRQRRHEHGAVLYEPAQMLGYIGPREKRGRRESVRLVRIVDEAEPHRFARLQLQHFGLDRIAGQEHVIFRS